MTDMVSPVRSFLFVPGNNPAWMEKAEQYKADGLVLDLEDAVPDREKAKAREHVMSYIDRHADQKALFVRINDLNSGEALADLHAVVRRGLRGLVVPKVDGPEDIKFVAKLLSWLEASAELEVGNILINPVLETALGIRNAYAIGRASDRIAYMGGIGVRGGDEERALGYRWSPSGKETFVVRSKVLLDVRAAGIVCPTTGLWTDVKDLDGLRRFAEEGRDLGYEGMVVIHPSHVAVVNDVFSITSDDEEYYRGLLHEMETARQSGKSSTVFRGQMIDTAMEKTARERLGIKGGSQ